MFLLLERLSITIRNVGSGTESVGGSKILRVALALCTRRLWEHIVTLLADPKNQSATAFGIRGETGIQRLDGSRPVGGLGYIHTGSFRHERPSCSGTASSTTPTRSTSASLTGPGELLTSAECLPTNFLENYHALGMSRNSASLDSPSHKCLLLVFHVRSRFLRSNVWSDFINP
jgi:hypothetical protein